MRFCPEPHCGLRIPAHLLACRSHWYRIPKELRDRLLREYHNHFGERSYFEARAECLRALGVPEEEIASIGVTTNEGGNEPPWRTTRKPRPV